jgi:hypothetical protein
MGGVVTPHSQSSTSFLAKWRTMRTWKDDRFVFGVGWGSDVNGFSAQGAPRNSKPGAGVTYPFTGFGGAIIHKQVTGKHTWDINTEGVDHYGLYPDWVQDLKVLAGPQGDELAADMERASEAFLQTWERALGVAGDACRTDVPDLTPQQLARAQKGMTPEEVLAAVGQPHARVGSTFTYCVQGGTATVEFGKRGTVTSVG